MDNSVCKQLRWFIFCKKCLYISYWFWLQPMMKAPSAPSSLLLPQDCWVTAVAMWVPYEMFTFQLSPGTGHQGQEHAPPFSCPENKAFQKAGLHSVSRSDTAMYIGVLEYIAEHTEQWGLPNAVSEKNNKLDQNLGLQPYAYCRSSNKTKQAHVLNSKVSHRCWSCFHGKLTHSVLSRFGQ